MLTTFINNKIHLWRGYFPEAGHAMTSHLLQGDEVEVELVMHVVHETDFRRRRLAENRHVDVIGDDVDDIRRRDATEAVGRAGDASGHHQVVCGMVVDRVIGAKEDVIPRVCNDPNVSDSCHFDAISSSMHVHVCTGCTLAAARNRLAFV